MQEQATSSQTATAGPTAGDAPIVAPVPRPIWRSPIAWGGVALLLGLLVTLSLWLWRSSIDPEPNRYPNWAGPLDVEPTSSQPSRQFTGEGWEALAADQTSAAIDYFERQSRLDPSVSMHHLGLARAQQKKGRLDEAELAYRKALACEDSQPSDQVELGYLLVEMKRYKEAEDIFLPIYFRNNDADEIQYGLGVTQLATGYPKSALEHLRKAAEKENTAAVQREIGRALHRLEEPEQALAAFQQAVELDPQDADAQLVLGDCLRHMKRPRESLAAYDRAAEIAPTNVEAWLGKAQCCTELDDLSAAITAYDRAIELEPRRPGVHALRGTALMKVYRVPDAIKSFRRGIEIEPDSAMLRYQLGTLLQLGAYFDEVFTKSTAQFQAEVDVLQRLDLSHSPAARKQLEEAVDVYRQALEINPGMAFVDLQMGQCLLKLNRNEEAEAAFKQAVAKDPRDYQSLLGLAASCYGQQRFADAAASMRPVLKLYPNEAQAHALLGFCLEKDRKLEEALASFRQAVKLGSQDVNVHLQMGYLLKNKGQLELAVEAFQAVTDIEPKRVEAHRMLAYALQQLGRLHESEASARQAIELNDQDHWSHYHLGVTLNALGHLAEANAALERATALDPAQPHVWALLVQTYRQTRRHAEAIAAADRALQLEPDNPWVLYHRGCVCMESGQYDEALETFKKTQVAGQRRQDWNTDMDFWIRQAEYNRDFVAAEGDLPKSGTRRFIYKTGAARRHFSARRYVHAAREAVSELRPGNSLTSDLERYNAACAAAMAACGEGELAEEAREAERARMLQHALSWLNEELKSIAAHAAQDDIHTRNAACAKLRWWQEDDLLAGVREPDALAKLPAENRAKWEAFWEKIEDVIAEAEE